MSKTYQWKCYWGAALFRIRAGIYCYLSSSTMNLWEIIVLTLLLLLLSGQVQKVHSFF